MTATLKQLYKLDEKEKQEETYKRAIHIHKRPQLYFAMFVIGVYYTLTQVILHGMFQLHDQLFQWGQILGVFLWTVYEILRFMTGLWIFLRIKRWGFKLN